MTVRCADLDSFFDAELEADQAEAFRQHLVTCKRCQDDLHGRMQESVAAYEDDPVLARGSRRSVLERRLVTREVPAPEVPAPVRQVAAPPPATTPARPAHSRDRRRRHPAVVLAPILAAAAALPLWLAVRSPEALALAIAVEPGTSVARDKTPRGKTAGERTARVGDILRTSAHGDRHRAIWVYLDDRHLVVACPSNDPRCSGDGDDLVLRLPLDAFGDYTIIALGSDTVVSVPAAGQTLDSAMAAQPASVHRVTDYIKVE
jgi:hypothetical protein